MPTVVDEEPLLEAIGGDTVFDGGCVEAIGPGGFSTVGEISRLPDKGTVLGENVSVDCENEIFGKSRPSGCAWVDIAGETGR